MSENRHVLTEVDTSSTLRIPADAQQRGTAFLHQQFWCWGYDIRHADGNLLRHYGFACQRPPDQTSGSSLYILHLPKGKIIALWGFGIWYAQADVGSLFLQRYSFAPRLAATIEPTIHLDADEPANALSSLYAGGRASRSIAPVRSSALDQEL